MKRAVILVALLITAAASTALAATVTPPQPGDPMPVLTLPKPADSDELKYLGLTGSGSFTVSQIKAQAVILQVFSMYCPYCQADAPNVNRLYSLIEKDPNLQGKIKLLGIGAGNTAFEVATFKRRYKVPFPLVHDPDFVTHKIVGEVRTPYFIVVKMSDSKKPEVVFSKLGAQEDIDAFLADIIKLADVK